MGTRWCVKPWYLSQTIVDELAIASTHHAHHSICDADEEQTAEKTVAFLLGGVSKVWRGWKIEAGDDLGLVSRCLHDVANVQIIMSMSHSNAIRNDLVSDTTAALQDLGDV